MCDERGTGALITRTSGLQGRGTLYIVYYCHSGDFHDVEDGVDFLDSDAFLKMKKWKVVSRPSALNDDSRSGGSWYYHPRGCLS